MKAKQLIFIDDSGDAGIRPHSSSHLVMSAVVFKDDLVAEEVALELRKFKRQLGWTDDKEYKFHSTKKDYIKQVLRLIAEYDFAIYAIVINKSRFDVTPKNLYNDSISELLRSIPLKKASIKIDGHTGTNYIKRALSDIRKNSNTRYGQIGDIKFGDSKENVLIQLADLVASSIFRSTQKNKADSQDYITILQRRIAAIKSH